MLQRLSVKKCLFIILACAVLIRVVAIIVTYQQVNDDWEYGEIAYNLAEGRGFSRINDPGGKLESTSSQAPLYPIFLSIFYSFGQTSIVFLTIKLIQLILSIITIFFFYKLVKILFDEKTGLIGALILTVYPPYIYNTIKITPIVLFITLLIISVYMLFKKEKLLTNALAGILFAIQ